MQAVVVKAFAGVPDGEVMPKTYNPGDAVSGGLAAVAVAEGWAEPAPEPELELQPAPAKAGKPKAGQKDG